MIEHIGIETGDHGNQAIDEVIDVANWPRDEEFAEYPEGARDKTLLYCPISSHGFLKTGHRYLFKRSSPRYLEQFWVEIFAYRLGVQMMVPVPPAFAAYDSKEKLSGALIEWFLDPGHEVYIPGGDYCQQYIPDFDRKKGGQHNFETIAKILSDLADKHPNFSVHWKEYWARMLTFDALIGNTDRHQDNWGIIVNRSQRGEVCISPVFDNGTSLGHEIFSKKFDFYNDVNRVEKYISKGCHHMKWSLNDASAIGHVELVRKLADKYSETRQIVLDCLKRVNHETFKSILNDLTAFDVPVKLTAERAKFMLELLQFRHQRLLTTLEN